MKRFWITFKLPLPAEHPMGLARGCGVTAQDLNDAMAMLQEHVFRENASPPIDDIVEDVDVSTLDPRHVLANMGFPGPRGIWFPMGFM